MASKSAIVTGAGAGIGAAIARHAAAAGYRVGVLDIDESKAAAVARELPNAIAIGADVTDEKSVERAFEKLGEELDLLVNNAGIVRFGPLVEQTPEMYRAVVEVNLVGCFIMSRAAAKRMLPRGSGCIVNITSMNAIAPGPNAGAYPATKAALANLTSHMAMEWGPSGLRVNAVAPGFIDAGISAPIYADEGVRKLRGSAVPSRRLGTADEIADAVMFLASDAAAYVNGHQLVVDGGVTPSLLMQLPREKAAGR
jgi:NAD(P)-dependent dehydrogenase (short-subunit alcohol dehydrogenase family)